MGIAAHVVSETLPWPTFPWGQEGGGEIGIFWYLEPFEQINAWRKHRGRQWTGLLHRAPGAPLSVRKAYSSEVAGHP